MRSMHSQSNERAHGWSTMSKIMREVDEQKIRDCKEDIDTILVFAGLFSAVMTAFLVESYQNLQEDPSVVTIDLLRQIAYQTSSYAVSSKFINSTTSMKFNNAPFAPSKNAIRVNVLWFASLTLSLMSASFGILVKQWLREYLAGEYTSAQARLRARHFRQPGIYDWKVFEISAILPLMLQVSLGLFFVGLCYFTADVHASVGHTTLPLVSGWAFLLVATSIAPAFTARCPYKMALLKRLMRLIRREVYHLARSSMLFRAKISSLFTNFAQVFELGVTSANNAIALHHLQQTGPSHDAVRPAGTRPGPYEEEDAVSTARLDIDILIAVDAIQSDDELLSSVMWDALKQAHTDGATIINFVFQVVCHRSQQYITTMSTSSVLDLTQMPKQTWIIITDIIADTLNSEIDLQIGQNLTSTLVWSSWMKDALVLLFSKSAYTLSERGQSVLVRILARGRHIDTIPIIVDRLPSSIPDSNFEHVLQRLRGPLTLFNSDDLAPVVKSLARTYICTEATHDHPTLRDVLRCHTNMLNPHGLDVLLRDILAMLLKDDYETWNAFTVEGLEAMIEFARAAHWGEADSPKFFATLLLDPRKTPALLRIAVCEKEDDSTLSQRAQLLVNNVLTRTDFSDRAKVLVNISESLWKPYHSGLMYKDAQGAFYELEPLKLCRLCLTAFQGTPVGERDSDPELIAAWQDLWGKFGMVIKYIARRRDEFGTEAANDCRALIQMLYSATDNILNSDSAPAALVDLYDALDVYLA